MTPEQVNIGNAAFELLRSMLMNPRVDPNASGLPKRAIELALELDSALQMAFSQPCPSYLEQKPELRT